ncbi:hypothetical protein [Methylobacterium fujisawaense]
MRILRPLFALALLLAPSLADAQGTVGGARVPNRPASDNSTAPANTAYVDAAVQVLLTAIGSKASLTSPNFVGTPTAPTPSAGNNSTQIANTAFVTGAVSAEASRAQAAEGLLAPLVSPSLTGAPTAPTPTSGDSSTRLATTAFVAATFLAKTDAASTYAALASPALTGAPTAPTPAASDSSTRIATTAYATGAVGAEATRAQAAEALLAPRFSPSFDGTVELKPGSKILLRSTAGSNLDKMLLVGSNGNLLVQDNAGAIILQVDQYGSIYTGGNAVVGSVFVQNVRVVGPRQPAIADSLSDSAKIAAILAALRTHGLIDPTP